MLVRETVPVHGGVGCAGHRDLPCTFSMHKKDTWISMKKAEPKLPGSTISSQGETQTELMWFAKFASIIYGHLPMRGLWCLCMYLRHHKWHESQPGQAF